MAINQVIRNLEAAPPDWRKFNPETLSLRLFGETDVPFVRVSFTITANGHATWIGRSTAADGWVVAVSDAAGWNAEVSLVRGNSYRVYASTRAVLSESPPAPLSCLPVNPTADDLPTREAASGLPSAQIALSRDTLTDEELSTVNVSTVSVLYDSDTEADIQRIKDAAGYSETPQELISLVVESAIELANIYLELSDIKNLRWEVGGVGKVQSYDFNGDYSMNRDLDTIATITTSAGQAARAFFIETHADQGVLLVGGDRDNDGLGETPGNHSVVAWYVSDYLSVLFAHELAHNFGCKHDRIAENVPDDNGLYSYGHAFTAAGDYIGTIMSYAGDYLLPQFSNPTVTYESVPTGIAVTEPKAAYNALVIREHAAAMAAYRKHPDDPAISRHPQSASLRTGETLSLNVATTGPNLRFQWYKDNARIEGATESSFTKSAITTADSGSYFVTVTNDRGSLTSIPATITISTASSGGGGTASGGSSSGGGGGGGGGAPSIWFLSALTLLLAQRSIRRQYSH